MTKKVYICPEDCNFFEEAGCKRLKDVDETTTYEKEGDYPVCPFYMKDLLAGKGMALEEAIKEGQQWLSTHPHLEGLKLYLAIQLGIESLKREQRKRKAVSLHRDDLFLLLPGETIDKGVANGL